MMPDNQLTSEELESLALRGEFSLLSRDRLEQLAVYLLDRRQAVVDNATLMQRQADEMAGELRASVRQLTLQLEESEQLRSQVAGERDQLHSQVVAERDRATAELEAFKAQVVEVAAQYASRHDWCTVVDEALGEMGLPPTKRGFTIRVQVSGYVDRRIEAHDLDEAVEEAESQVGINAGTSYQLHYETFEVTNVSTEEVVD